MKRFFVLMVLLALVVAGCATTATTTAKQQEKAMRRMQWGLSEFQKGKEAYDAKDYQKAFNTLHLAASIFAGNSLTSGTKEHCEAAILSAESELRSGIGHINGLIDLEVYLQNFDKELQKYYTKEVKQVTPDMQDCLARAYLMYGKLNFREAYWREANRVTAGEDNVVGQASGRTEYQTAQKYLTKALALKPIPEAYALRAEATARLLTYKEWHDVESKAKQALEDAQKAAELEPTKYAHVKAKVLSLLGLSKEALAEIERVLQANVSDDVKAQLYYIKGDTILFGSDKKSRFKQAIEAYDEAIKHDYIAEAYLMKGVVLMQMGNFDEALSYLEKSTKYTNYMNEGRIKSLSSHFRNKAQALKKKALEEAQQPGGWTW